MLWEDRVIPGEILEFEGKQWKVLYTSLTTVALEQVEKSTTSPYRIRLVDTQVFETNQTRRLNVGPNIVKEKKIKTEPKARHDRKSTFVIGENIFQRPVLKSPRRPTISRGFTNHNRMTMYDA